MSALYSTAVLCPSAIDWSVVWVLLGVTGIVLLQIAVVIAFLWDRKKRSETRWRLLRERGVVIIDGPALIWVNDLPPRPTLSTFNLRGNLQKFK
ncbi:hypothetical protein T440DRAFT_404927 [Plenodomus tracheiphilus IPT5]|uniref:Uncharacterized protein n=1 Tax=Plenodomus tracheiphilus IPT5 TaxID=1408161 RepID=A0A6A7AUT8_9PLEO|nr:hypothetical protein T440DRAFT_404927 [Plenodomus tracheiphilus IPT5]